MTKDDVFFFLQESFRQVAPEIEFQSIKFDRPLRDQVEIDSLDLYNIFNLLEKKTQVHVTESQMATLSTLNEWLDLIVSQLSPSFSFDRQESQSE